ncbi:putative quinol monooxygenase [Acinetobacter baumannii]|uniref:putative quinol monooxygenase n=1 Tax=Acinetobacter baumannii TaxID=470 RepID=UPI001C0DA974|nr:putative quinol monooxygenase [Acinetobacter baumannii]MBU3081597.1 antibiotic biosynthesis monooxygenase [Acinetobacter baumannii]
MTNEIKIIAQLTINDMYYDEVLDELRHLAKLSKLEAGNISYQLHKDIYTKDSIILIEHWKSMEAFEKHKETDHFKSYQNNTKNMILNDKITILKNIN